MDQTSLALVGSAFGGAIVTTAIGLLTHALTGRREHKRWLLDLRYQAYLKVIASVEQLLTVQNDPETFHSSLEKTAEIMQDYNTAEMYMLANQRSMKAYVQLNRAYFEFTKHAMESREDQKPYRTAMDNAFNECVKAFRQELKVPGFAVPSL